MSFILDALRKSERERQRNQDPGVAATRFIQRPARAVWLPLVIALVVINVCLLVYLGLRDSGPTEPVTSQTTSPAGTQPASAPPPRAPAEQSVETGNRRLRAELEPQSGKVNPRAPRPAPAAAAPATSRVPPAQEAETVADEYANLPTLTELSLAGSMTLPPLRIDIHVYSQQPPERFVFINMSKYREGDTLSEGPNLQAVTPGGVVLSYQGRDFLVTRE
jgi:general secretion pathway protein B